MHEGVRRSPGPERLVKGREGGTARPFQPRRPRRHRPAGGGTPAGRIAEGHTGLSGVATSDHDDGGGLDPGGEHGQAVPPEEPVRRTRRAGAQNEA
ncbi:hypothetical protein ABT340_13670 [Streptosporangium sp. NPDC000239]|uniref:hypothetical protein n=1 Tax=Streptosporangium sp. NPDC000239 TaxID=3154248 RepID=UPI003327E6B7